MPLTHFICPDGAKIQVTDCLAEGGCRMGNRCATRSYLRLVSTERPWTGKPSTTQLIRGTMESFLRLTTDYATSPDGRAFMINGTKAHSALEAADDEFSLLEQRFDGDDVQETGISDVIEIEDGCTILADYKTSGSFKVAKALGFRVVERPSGEVYKSGKRKGEEKMIRELVRDDQYIDRWEWELQLNKYRIESTKLGFRPDELRIQCVVRDGGTFIARSRGVFRNVYYFKINMLPDEEVLAFFKSKREALAQALKQGDWTEACGGKENWDGLKCQRYCDVAEFCPLGKYLKHEKESEDEMIKGLSQVRRLPRLGKIRLGIKKVTAEGKEYPAEIDYFKLDPQTPSAEENEKLIKLFTKLYGEKPKQITIMFPVPDPNVFFPQFYKRYASGVLRCKGDGETASCISKEHAEGLEILGDNELGGVNVRCPGKECQYYQQKKCGESAALQVLLPELPGAGVWEIPTGSFHSIVNVNSCIEFIRGVCGRVHMMPLKLERREQAITHDGKTRNHYILHVSMDRALADLQAMAQIDATKILLELPEPEPDKEDIYLQENRVVDAVAQAVEDFPDSGALLAEYSRKFINCESVEDLKKIKNDAVRNAKNRMIKEDYEALKQNYLAAENHLGGK